jgi:hypothetical protein
MPPGPGTETTGRIRPPGNASHSRGLSAAGSSGTLPMITIFLRSLTRVISGPTGYCRVGLTLTWMALSGFAFYGVTAPMTARGRR